MSRSRKKDHKAIIQKCLNSSISSLPSIPQGDTPPVTYIFEFEGTKFEFSNYQDFLECEKTMQRVMYADSNKVNRALKRAIKKRKKQERVQKFHEKQAAQSTMKFSNDITPAYRATGIRSLVSNVPALPYKEPWYQKFFNIEYDWKDASILCYIIEGKDGSIQAVTNKTLLLAILHNKTSSEMYSYYDCKNKDAYETVNGTLKSNSYGVTKEHFIDLDDIPLCMMQNMR